MDRHKIWRIVRSNYESLKQASPDGYAPVVEVFLVGRPEPVRLGEVQTSRDEAFAWVFLSAATDVSGDVASGRDERLILIPEQYVQRIEICFAPLNDVGVGFSYRELEEPPPASSEE